MQPTRLVDDILPVNLPNKLHRTILSRFSQSNCNTAAAAAAGCENIDPLAAFIGVLTGVNHCC